MDNTTAVEKQEIAENLNKYFTNIGPNLTSKIPNEQGDFEKYLPNCNSAMNDTPLRYIFSNSLAQEIFPKEMKIAKMTLINKSGDKENVLNYRLISILLCFSKILERIINNRLHLYLTESNLLYNKQFDFQKERFTDHAIVQIPDQIRRIFNKKIFTIGVFINMFKASDTVNDKILLIIYLLLVIFLTGNSL